MARLHLRRQDGAARGAGVLLALTLLVLLGLFLWNVTWQRPVDGLITTDVGQLTSAGAITIDGEELGRPDQLAALVGQAVQLKAVRVRDVVGDETFWVGPSAGQRLFVVFDESGIRDEAVKVTAGQTVTIVGELRELPSPEEARRRWGLTPRVGEALRGQQVYLYTRLVTIVSGG